MPLRLIPVTLTFLLFVPGLCATPSSEQYRLLRSGQWQSLLNHWRHRPPANADELYLQAAAIAGSAGNHNPAHLAAIETWLASAGIECGRPGRDETLQRSEAALRSCLVEKPIESHTHFRSRLAIWKAAERAKEREWQALSGAILTMADLSTDDPVSGRIFWERISFLIQSGQRGQAEAVARKWEGVSGVLPDFWRGRALLRNGKRDEALPWLLKAAEATRTEWILRAILGDFRLGWPDLLERGQPFEALRGQVHFVALLSKEEQQSLHRHLSIERLIESSSSGSVAGDGLFLIATGNERSLNQLSEKHYTHLSHNPALLHAWAAALAERQAHTAFNQLYRTFEHARAGHRGFWRLRLDHLQRHDRLAYFRELLEFLAVNHADIDAYDRLIEFLIGSSRESATFAPENYWREAERSLPRATASGRFVYWLHRYHSEHNHRTDVERIERDFYLMAPGSYYAQAFWDRLSPGNFRADWQGVKSRDDYLRWIGRHGGNREALTFLATRRSEIPLDPEAVKLWQRFAKGDFKVPPEIGYLFKIGELQLGHQFFNHHFSGVLAPGEREAHQAQAGLDGENHFISVYFMRSLLRELNIAEDPWSLPREVIAVVYPRPYHAEVKKYATQYGIAEGMVYGLMHQESMFREGAISRSGARGLMQIMPRTGEWLAGQMKIESYDLLDPETSINLGSKFFADLLRNYDNDFRWAAIAYNGGPGNLRRWRREYYRDDFNLFLERLPVAEPRNYCRITYQNFQHYLIGYTLHP